MHVVSEKERSPSLFRGAGGTRVSRVVECLQMRHPANGPILDAKLNTKKEGIYEGCALNYPGTGVKFIT